jgi:hypothetical protein
MVVKKAVKIVAAWVVVLGFVFGGSYLEEAPKYHFERLAMDVGRSVAGARLLSTTQPLELTSPISWFWPAATTVNFATPDPMMQDRFYLLSFVYERHEPDVHLLDADCEARKGEWYDLDEPETAPPARDVLGEPVVARGGKTFRRLRTQIPFPPQWIRAFCDTDWTSERKAALAARYKQ